MTAIEALHALQLCTHWTCQHHSNESTPAVGLSC